MKRAYHEIFLFKKLVQVSKKNKYGFKTARSGHCIYAKDKEDALQIAEEMGVSYPRYSENISKRTIQEINGNSALVNRRKQGIGGIIWKRDEL